MICAIIWLITWIYLDCVVEKFSPVERKTRKTDETVVAAVERFLLFLEVSKAKKDREGG
jgi:hypothetical protein